MPVDGPSLLMLNDDVLDLVIDMASTVQTLPSLSRTCWRIRSRSMPVLFRECSLVNLVPVTAATFVPPALWPYISILRFVDCCPDRTLTAERLTARQRKNLLRYSKDEMLCGVYNGSFLENALTQMPRLRTVSFRLPSLAAHGIPWPVLRLLLSLAQIRELSFDFHRLAPSLAPDDVVALVSQTHLTSFCFNLADYRARSQAFPSERAVLSLILSKNHKTLQSLKLSLDAAPLEQICTALYWPSLVELRLRGQYRKIGDPPLPLISMFANMPHLQTLELKLGQPVGVDPRPFWPSGHIAEWPWPELRHLTLTCPQVDDQVYTALPTGLLSLSLRYSPHYADVEWRKVRDHHFDDAIWQWPLLRSSELLGILQRCRLPSLSHLEIEYREDDADEELLSFIGAAFPTLASLKVMRYREATATSVPQERIQRALAALPRLRTLALHLDLPDAPLQECFLIPYGFGGVSYNDQELEAFSLVLQALADSLAGALGPSLETIQLMSPSQPAFVYWAEFGVVRDGDARVRAQLLPPRSRLPRHPLLN